MEEDLSDIRGRYGFPNEVQLHLPLPDERADTVLEGWICMYTIYFECGLRIPIPPLLIQSMHHYQLAIPQLMPNGMRVFLGLIVLADETGVKLSVDDILAIYYPQENLKDHGRYSMYPRRKKQVVGEMKNADRYWQDHYFFMHVKEKSMGGLANVFYPLWVILRKEMKKPPPKALLFEEKLEREWLRRLFGPPLFIEPLFDKEALITELALDIMSVEFPNPKDLLAKKKAQKEAAKAAAASSARGNEPPPLLVIESSPEPPVMPVQSPAKKRKANGKPKRKIPAKRTKSSKAASPETNVEPGKSEQDDQKIGVNLPPGMSLL
ncbi:hypothetical protein TIFTF001_029228 [Ficus carica]|uniref:Transposase (putative) gypsy type domain-containing protein n=1 Tax=Ficus carica TaxID=3494 RepID=A0AA88DVF1_FICCA|nr:hypothetical protein TIFTF001_029228 [Ficus carica]